ncbi:MAG TPA: hypothetical protein VN976_21805 [Verrucomicrobiae bacterium]|nr:hypothetical protein [Verrucomicrobiae bacterium]
MVQPALQKIVCFFIGHLPIGRLGLWYVQRQFLEDGVEALCIRCGKKYRFHQELEENFFAESPLYKSLRDHRLEVPKKGEGSR